MNRTVGLMAGPTVRFQTGNTTVYREQNRLTILFILGLLITSFAMMGCLWISWQLLLQNGRILHRLDELENLLDKTELTELEEIAGLTLGSLAPDFELPDLNGEQRTLTEFRGESLLLIFFNPGCRFCRDLLPELERLEIGSQESEREGIAASASANGLTRVLIVSNGDVEKNRQFFAEHKVKCSILVQREEMEVSAAYMVSRTPSGYLINSEGRLASQLVVGAEMLLTVATKHGKAQRQIEQSIAINAESAATTGDERQRSNPFRNHSLVGSKIDRNGLKAGTQAPEFQLPRLSGEGTLFLKELHGSRVLLVFSSPDCGPCNRLAPQLERFHLEHPELALVMISKGDPGGNQVKVKEHGLTFPVVLQRGWEISRRYAIFATPAAYLIDPNGITVRDVAVGVDPILKLLDNVGREAEDIFGMAAPSAVG